MTGSPAQPELRIFRFPPGTSFEGALVGAIERMDRPGSARLLDALFVLRDAESGELEAVDLETGRADGTVAAMLDFRLDPARRRAMTERTLAHRAGAVPATVVEAMGAALEPGGAILAVLVAGGAAEELDEAVRRSGGRLLASEHVDAKTLADVAPLLRAEE